MLTPNIQTILFTSGALFAFSALSTKKLISLRLLYVGASSSYISYGLYVGLPEIVFWNSINFFINAVRIFQYFVEAKTWLLNNEEIALYKKFFKHFMMPGQFLKIINLAEKKSYKDTVILKEGVDNQNLYFITEIDGKVMVKKGGTAIADLANHNFFGEMSFLKKQKTNAAIHVQGAMSCYYWSEEKLRQLKRKKPDIYNILTLILSHDLVEKLGKPTIS